MKNKPIDVVNMLITRGNRLSDESLTGDELREEIERSKATAELAKTIVGVYDATNNAMKIAHEAGMTVDSVPALESKPSNSNGQ